MDTDMGLMSGIKVKALRGWIIEHCIQLGCACIEQNPTACRPSMSALKAHFWQMQARDSSVQS